VRAYDYFHKDSAVVSLLASILGSGLSSRLFKKMRDEMGVCYYVRAENDSALDHGFFGISAGVDNKRLIEVIEVLLDELKN